MRIAERQRRSDCAALIRSCRCAGVTPKRKTTVLLCDGFAVLDREWPDVDSKLGGNGSDWLVT
jgi:hypothetical protein